MLRNITTHLLRANLSCAVSLHSSVGIRFLYTPEALGLDGYSQVRTKAALQFVGDGMKEKFKLRMQEIVNSESSNIIFTDDLKTMLNLAENTPEDIVLLKQMVERFHCQSTGLRFGTFVFGPVIMRFFHMFNQPKEALSLIQNPQTIGLFDQFMTYQILMDLLFENKMYGEVVDIFSQIQERNIQGNRFPKNCLILAMAALYRQNTPESLEKMKSILKEAEEAGNVPLRRSLTYAAALAINQDDPRSALNILTGSAHPNYVTVRNLKALAFAKMGRLEDSFALLRSPLEIGQASPDRKRTFCGDVLEEIGVIVKRSDNKEAQLEFERINKNLSERRLIDNQPLEQILNIPIIKLDPSGRNAWGAGSFDRDVAKNSFNNRDRLQRNTSRPVFPPRRRGLGDLE